MSILTSTRHYERNSQRALSLSQLAHRSYDKIAFFPYTNSSDYLSILAF